MKIRDGFVSNSSSSSFIIHKSFLTDKQYLHLTAWLNEMEEELEQFSYESGRTWSRENDYIFIETYDLSGFSEKLQELGINEKLGANFD